MKHTNRSTTVATDSRKRLLRLLETDENFTWDEQLQK
jgi:hypothetical protein